jgi:hypothetical protein
MHYVFHDCKLLQIHNLAGRRQKDRRLLMNDGQLNYENLCCTLQLS